MKEITAYLNFNGNCREAMEFYAKCLGAELFTMPFAEAKMDVPKEARNRLMHARLTKGRTMLMASDTLPAMEFKPGNNFSVSLECDSAAEADKLFSALGEKGKVTMPLQETFWAARFGMLRDRFGIHWMLNVNKPQSAQSAQ